ncbi:hypothetical protein [Burkholderia gladioli]|uniref:hypothetical protein n=1 Tax=Burkholderia gladioli TaxID=28095 RepID=UPI001640FC7A|nr:hypothetical protein [Burkholderia gladioli]
MRTDRRIASVPALSTRQRFFCDCWFNLVHQASLDAFRVRAMNPLNVVRELLRMMDVEHAKEADVGRVLLEAYEVLGSSTIYLDTAFQPVADHFQSLVKTIAEEQGVKKLVQGGGKSHDVGKLAGGRAIKDRPLLDAFGRELIHKLEHAFIPRCVNWLAVEVNAPDSGDTFDALSPNLVKIENVLSGLLSALVNRGWSFPSLFTLYRELLLPVDAGEGAAPYVFSDALREVFDRLTAEPKPYRIVFQINGATKPTNFPPVVGDISFSPAPPTLSAESSRHAQRYATPFGGRLFASMTVQAQDGRIAGSVASDHIAAVLDVVRYDYERKNIRLEETFLVEKDDRHIQLPLPGSVPNPDSSLSTAQLETFMRRLQELVSSGSLTSETKDRIYSAFRLYRTGADSSNFENKLVNWWTAVEYLVKGDGGGSDSIGNGVEQSLAPTVVLSYLPKHLNAMRDILVNQLKIELSDAAGNQIELKELGLADFYRLLHDHAHRAAIDAACADVPFVRLHFQRLLATFIDGTKLKEALRNHERRMRWHVQRIYRARCDIVHSGQRMVDATLLCANLEFYLKTILASFLEALHRHPTLRSAREFFDRQEYALERVRDEITTGTSPTLMTMLASRDIVAAAP